MAGKDDKNMKSLVDVWRRPENALCADCQKPDPDWASYTLGVFICLNCSGIHRNIPNISKVKSLRMDHWDEAQVQFLEQHGNAAAKATYEAHIPIYYYQPTHADCQVLREQWIRAKYERKEFTEPERQLLYSNGLKEGLLWKRGRDNGQFLPRKFLLSERDGCLKYFAKPDEIVDWFNAIRAVQFHYLKVAFPMASDSEIKSRLMQNFLKEGYMEKTGPKGVLSTYNVSSSPPQQKEAFKKRWFTLAHRRLMYFKDPLDAFAKGEVFVGSREHGYSVKQGLPPGTQGSFSWQYGLTIVTPDREYLFTCETESDQQDWVAAFSQVIEQPMTPQEYAIEAYFKLSS
ncbi:arf-GAP with dual PH domain-containing protein 1-like isoform X5 [Carettochelys insculpta]|uniref:arf-GAP with dual PH domain-containing protein 1-like isoform X5 n=1 Tax=Carettochelys insculpta TaxID=44489 RepID=UPI003EBE195D